MAILTEKKLPRGAAASMRWARGMLGTERAILKTSITSTGEEEEEEEEKEWTISNNISSAESVFLWARSISSRRQWSAARLVQARAHRSRMASRESSAASNSWLKRCSWSSA